MISKKVCDDPLTIYVRIVSVDCWHQINEGKIFLFYFILYIFRFIFIFYVLLPNPILYFSIVKSPNMNYNSNWLSFENTSMLFLRQKRFFPPHGYKGECICALKNIYFCSLIYFLLHTINYVIHVFWTT